MAKQSNKLTAKEVKNLSFDVNGAKKKKQRKDILTVVRLCCINT